MSQEKMLDTGMEFCTKYLQRGLEEAINDGHDTVPFLNLALMAHEHAKSVADNVVDMGKIVETLATKGRSDLSEEILQIMRNAAQGKTISKEQAATVLEAFQTAQETFSTIIDVGHAMKEPPHFPEFEAKPSTPTNGKKPPIAKA